MDEFAGKGFEKNPLELGSAYLDYCVKQGWLSKKGDGESATYILTADGEKKFEGVSINFDLSPVEKINREPKRKYRRRK